MVYFPPRWPALWRSQIQSDAQLILLSICSVGLHCKMTLRRSHPHSSTTQPGEAFRELTFKSPLCHDEKDLTHVAVTPSHMRPSALPKMGPFCFKTSTWCLASLFTDPFIMLTLNLSTCSSNRLLISIESGFQNGLANFRIYLLHSVKLTSSCVGRPCKGVSIRNSQPNNF
jgi:hypothetical protein